MNLLFILLTRNSELSSLYPIVPEPCKADTHSSRNLFLVRQITTGLNLKHICWQPKWTAFLRRFLPAVLVGNLWVLTSLPVTFCPSTSATEHFLLKRCDFEGQHHGESSERDGGRCRNRAAVITGAKQTALLRGCTAAPCLPALLRAQMWRQIYLALAEALKILPGTLARCVAPGQLTGGCRETVCSLCWGIDLLLHHMFTCSKHVASVLISGLCPVPPPHALPFGAAVAPSQNRPAVEACQRKPVPLTASDNVSPFFHAASLPPDVRCSLRVLEAL